MFQWYQNSAICYAYLVDVSRPNIHTDFPKSRWHTRGWTLQELLAPTEVVFYDRDWEEFATKLDHAGWISDITAVDRNILVERDQVGSACVAKRMS